MSECTMNQHGEIPKGRYRTRDNSGVTHEYSLSGNPGQRDMLDFKET